MLGVYAKPVEGVLLLSDGSSNAKSVGEEESCDMTGAERSRGVDQVPANMPSGVLTGGVNGMLKKVDQSSTSVAVDDDVVGRASGTDAKGRMGLQGAGREGMRIDIWIHEVQGGAMRDNVSMRVGSGGG